MIEESNPAKPDKVDLLSYADESDLNKKTGAPTGGRELLLVIGLDAAPQEFVT